MPSNAFSRLVDRMQRDSAFREELRAHPLATLAEFDLTDDERTQIIVPNFGWLIEGHLAGVSRPRADDALATLHVLGIRALLTLTEEPIPSDTLDAHGLQAVHIPIADFTAPTLDQVGHAVATIDHFLLGGWPVAGHCGAGLGRTGTILACYLVAQGTSAAEAIRKIRSQRPGPIETSEQEAVVMQFEYFRKE